MKSSNAGALVGAMMAVAGGLPKSLTRLLTQEYRPGSHADRVAKHFKAHEGCEKKYSVGSRQRLRATARKARLEAINKEFGQENRSARRGLALRPFKVKSWKIGPRAGRHQ